MSMIRRAESLDSAPINRISRTLGYEEVSDAVVQKWLDAINASEEHRVWVCEINGETVAWLHASRSARLVSAPFIEIVGLAVDQIHRREGVGRGLVNEAVSWARSQELKLRVRCNSGRTQSHKFYEALGFVSAKSQVVYECCLQHPDTTAAGAAS